METKEWTLMFYFASDNPLASTIVSQLKAIKDAGFHPDANVLAHFDPHVANTPVHTFDVNAINKFWSPGQSEVGFTSNNPFVRDLVLDRLWDEQNENIRKLVVNHVEGTPEKYIPDTVFDPPRPSAAMCREQDPGESLSSFLDFCHQSYPARHYMLFILGHGQVVGNDSLLYDDHAARHSLTLTELGEILRSFSCEVRNDKEAGTVEMIGLHSCSMSAMEVAYELKGAANYLLASQGPLYPGNLPYRQILIRIFNDLDARLTPDDINGRRDGKDGKQSFVEKLFRADDSVSNYVRKTLASTTEDFLSRYQPDTQPEPELVAGIVDDLNRLINGEELSHAEVFLNLPSTNGTKFLKGKELWGVNRRRFHRLLLSDAYPEIARHPKLNIESMLEKIFYYCLYNSYDFQLAGYPFDLCLLNLAKVSDTEDPINKLAESLIAGLQDGNPTPKQLILLAHWDAQSFYNEEYVDLYDFCFCLMKRCRETYKNPADMIPSVQRIYEACTAMRKILAKGPEKMINLAAFSGAAFQYSHGLSIYFPWSKPVEDVMWDEHYAEYRLNKKTKWREFLHVYFKETRRKTRAQEFKAEIREDEGCTAEAKRNLRKETSLSADVLELVSRIGLHVFAGDGALAQKPGPDHPMGKYGPDDPQGSSCECPSIKNYPLFTGFEVGDNGKTVRSVPVSADFFDGMDRLK